LPHNTLKGQTAIVTGAGRGIGYEAARALVWLGARVVLAEIDEQTGRKAAAELENEFGPGVVAFIRTDVGQADEVERLARETERLLGKVDIVLNNATIFPIGAVKDKPIEAWDASYRVNLRGPVLLARAFLPMMIERHYGVFVCVSSSGAVPYMGPYEVFKTAQVELSNTLSAELEGTGVHAFTIGPGIVRTPGFLDGGGQVAEHMGLSIDALLDMNRAALLTAEAAGTGFAASIALASRYDGQETSSIQVLRDIGIVLGVPSDVPSSEVKLNTERVTDLQRAVLKTYMEQSEGWKRRNIFERQWVFRDFKKQTGSSVDEMLGRLEDLGSTLKEHRSPSGCIDFLNRLSAYYLHQEDLLKGFEKDPQKVAKTLQEMDRWIGEVKELASALGSQ
jgi:NAD(P)-dependent dehydrogenase (short-subunit alcohol dehydrogenase family)